MPSSLLPIFKRKLYCLLQKWKGMVKQTEPIDVPYLLMLLQLMGFRGIDRSETGSTVSMQIVCSNHPNRVYTLEMPMKDGICNCIKPADKDRPSTSGGIVWRTRQIFPLQNITAGIQEYTRIILVTLVELIIRVTHSREDVHKLLGKEVDIGLIFDPVPKESQSKAVLPEVQSSGEVRAESITQMAEYLKTAMNFIDMTLSEIPEKFRNTEKPLTQIIPKKTFSLRFRKSPKISMSPSASESSRDPLSLSTSVTSALESRDSKSSLRKGILGFFRRKRLRSI